jgi:hypothetical protein
VTTGNIEIAYMPTNSSLANRVEAQVAALRYFALDGTDHSTHNEQTSIDPPLHHLGTTTPTTNGSARGHSGEVG